MEWAYTSHSCSRKQATKLWIDVDSCWIAGWRSRVKLELNEMAWIASEVQLFKEFHKLEILLSMYIQIYIYITN